MGCREVPAQITPLGVTHLGAGDLGSCLTMDWASAMGCLAFVGPLMPAGHGAHRAVLLLVKSLASLGISTGVINASGLLLLHGVFTGMGLLALGSLISAPVPCAPEFLNQEGVCRAESCQPRCLQG